MCEESAGIKPGRGITAGTTKGKQALLPDAAADITTGGMFEGISLWVQGREPGGDDGEYEDEETMPVMRKGLVWVLTEDAVAYGAAVYCRHTISGSEEEGTFRSDADGADASVVPTAQYRSATSGAALALVEINLP